MISTTQPQLIAGTERHYPRHRELRPRRSILRNSSSSEDSEPRREGSAPQRRHTLNSYPIYEPTQFDPPHSAPPQWTRPSQTIHYSHSYHSESTDRAKILIHHLLTRQNTVSMPADFLLWDMRFPPEGNARRHRNFALHPFYTFSDQPVTSPKFGCIRLTSIDFPWEIVIEASNSVAGVTIGDLFEALYVEMDQPLLQTELIGASPVYIQQISEACRVRESMIYPANFTFGSLKRIDWLMGNTAFCGLVEDASEFVPGTMLFLCGVSEVEALRRGVGIMH